MQRIIKIKSTPGLLQEEEKRFLRDCKGTNDPWGFYKENQKNYNYNTRDAKYELLRSSDYRCAICSRRIYDSANRSSMDEQHTFTIEHIRPKHKYPRLIFNWANMIPCCAECNVARGDKEYKQELYIDPSTDDCREMFFFSFDGSVCSSDRKNDHKVDYMIGLYNLNGDSKKRCIKSQRRWYFKMLIDEDYQKMVELNEILGLSDNIIIFKDMYSFIERSIQDE